MFLVKIKNMRAKFKVSLCCLEEEMRMSPKISGDVKIREKMVK